MFVLANKKESGILEYDTNEKTFIFNYTQSNPISLTMPYTLKSYLSSYHLHPIFDMNMPEGYLFALFKNIVIKEYGDSNDYLLFSYLSRTIEGYLTYTDFQQQPSPFELDLESVLHTSDTNLFSKLVDLFVHQSAISGVQPKVLAPLRDKATLLHKEYIIKSFSDEYPHLAENEYFCMKALQYAQIPTAHFWLSDTKKLFIMEKFTYQKVDDLFYGFEEFCVLFGFNKEKKYTGSYEQIAKAILKISTQREKDLKNFFKMVVMNYLLKNGDAHLKNFGILYTADFSHRFLAPAYDVVNTCVYFPKDKPALTLLGNKVWTSKKNLLKFGESYCLLSTKEAKGDFDLCIQAVIQIKEEIIRYIKTNESFSEMGRRFVTILDFSLEENLNTEYKDISNGIL